MKKKLLVAALLACSVPVVANAAWNFTTWARNPGGTISSRNNASQDSSNGSIFRSYTTPSTLSVKVTPITGYTIAAITVNGVVQPVTDSSSPWENSILRGGETTATSLQVSFARKVLPATATAGANGTVSPTSLNNVYYGVTSSAITFKFTPNNNYKVASITGNAAPFVTSPAVASAGVNQVVTVTIPKGTNLASAVNLSAVFSTAVVLPPNAGPDQAVAWNKVVTLTGTGIGTWSKISGPDVTLTGTNPVTFNSGNANADYVFAYGGDQVKVTTNMENAALTTCVNCHNGAGVGQVQAAYSSNGQQFKAKINVYNAWTASNHKTAGVVCYTCHVGADSGAHPGVVAANVCTPCHGTTVPSMNADAAHTATAGGSTPSAGCIGCHNVGQNAGAAYVQDNNGVRAITTEFTKWSHHVTGVTLQNAHCAACHLEGKVQDGVIVTDPAYHMVDAKTHLRNADTNADIQWDPAAPSHSNMDNFCMSCHDSNGATGIAAIQAVMIPATGKTASASNPFGDTISNQYDHLERPAVVDAAGQFATGNPSHHAVLGKKYSGRSRVSKGGTIVDAAFTANSSATNPGKRSTIFDAGKFTATYTTLADAVGESGARNGGTSLGDDSTLHCGDCHTVGQFRAADVNVAPFNKVVIGAHGSNNEYMLRNNAGTDVRHTTNFRTDGVNGFVAQDGNKPYLVCYNCHAIAAYGLNVAHAGEHDTTSISRGSDCNGPLNTNAATGEARLIAQSSGGATPTIPKAGTEYGNMFGIQCAACHNSGVKGNIFGGIHGSKEQTYTDGAGNTTKHRRFMPGLNNAMFVPGTLGGVTGGTTATYTNYSSNWLTGDALRYTAKAVNNNAYVLNPVDAALAAGRKAHNGTPSYTYQTGGVTNDLNWEQWKAQPIAGALYAGNTPMGCYTVSPNPTGPVAGAASAWSAAVPTSNYQSASTTTAGSRAAIAAPTGVVSQPVIAKLAVDGYPADDVRYSASYELTAGDGREVFETWGGCDDHNGAKGAGTSPTRNVLRPATY